MGAFVLRFCKKVKDGCLLKNLPQEQNAPGSRLCMILTSSNSSGSSSSLASWISSRFSRRLGTLGDSRRMYQFSKSAAEPQMLLAALPPKYGTARQEEERCLSGVTSNKMPN
jgi:hypothetical protein